MCDILLPVHLLGSLSSRVDGTKSTKNHCSEKLM